MKLKTALISACDYIIVCYKSIKCLYAAYKC